VISVEVDDDKNSCLQRNLADAMPVELTTGHEPGSPSRKRRQRRVFYEQQLKGNRKSDSSSDRQDLRVVQEESVSFVLDKQLRHSSAAPRKVACLDRGT